VSVTPHLVVSVHDVAPSTAWATRYWSTELERRGVPATFLVVPGPWEGPSFRFDAELVRWLHGRVEHGDEVAQHGWTHRPGRGGAPWRRAVNAIAARGSAEFWTLDEAEARRRAALGRDALRSAGFEPIGFTPPGWLASPDAMRALEQLGYRYATSQRAVVDLHRGVRHTVVALSQRPDGIGQSMGAACTPAAARLLVRGGRSVRIALHPRDLGHPRLAAASLDAVDAVCGAGAVACTYEAFVEAAAEALPSSGRAA
jgi:predicted deacetylase